jgi:hypothetical protein
VRAEIEATGTPLGFAIRYWKGVVSEFGVQMTYRSAPDTPAIAPERCWTMARHDAERFPMDTPPPEPPAAPATADAANGDSATANAAAARVRRMVPARLRPPLRRAATRARRMTASG